MNNKVTLNLPPYINIVIFKQKDNNINIYLYNKLYFIYLNNLIDKNYYKYDSETNSLTIIKLNPNKNNSQSVNFLNQFLKSLDIYFFFKIKFKGKGYRIRFYKKNKIVKFYFGKSHITFFFFKKLILKKISKYKFIIKNPNPFNLKNTAVKITKIKPINVYTLRGLRIARQTIYKRKGKKGSYI